MKYFIRIYIRLQVLLYHNVLFLSTNLCQIVSNMALDELSAYFQIQSDFAKSNSKGCHSKKKKLFTEILSEGKWHNRCG